MQYLIFSDAALEAQAAVARRRFGNEIDDGEGGFVSPWVTEKPFQIIHHPTSNFSAICLPDDIPLGMQGGEDWTRGKDREYNGETVTGAASLDEVVDNLYPTNRPLKDHQYMVDNGWYIYD